MVVWGANGFGNSVKFFDDYDTVVSFVHGLVKSILADVIQIYEWDDENDKYEFLREV
jgi:hypothetical protein